MGRVKKTHFVVIICQSLPVVVPNHLPLMVEVIGLHVEWLKTWLSVNASKVVVPSDSGGSTGVHIDPDESELIDMHMYWV